MSGDDRAANDDPAPDGGPQESPLRQMVKRLAALTPWSLKRKIEAGSLRADRIEGAIQVLQTELAELREHRFAPLEERIDRAELALSEVSNEAGRLRDAVLPAAVARADTLLDRLAGELEEVTSLVERMLQREPLPVPREGTIDEGRLAQSLGEVQPMLLKAFRGSEEEIRHRLDHYLAELQSAPPLLDLGCGRGELLLMMREAGVKAIGVEGDVSLAAAAQRRGLELQVGDVLEVLKTQQSESFGSVTAIHLLEHLQAPILAAVLAEVLRVLRPGGLFLAECPNPHTLRVGAALYWQDPTHQRPLLPETLELFLSAAGFSIRPQDQMLMDDDGGTQTMTDPEVTELAERLDRLRRRLDEILNGPRDFAVWAIKPNPTEQN
jgi:SAM-dependent methyltransferase